MIKNAELLKNGLIETTFPLEENVKTLLLEKNWKELDQYFLDLSKPGGLLRNFFNEFLDYEKLEHIIAIRTAPEDEDGIWHDDGSRFLGFSLSLNLFPEAIQGGELLFRLKGKKEVVIFTPRPYGTMIIFLSGLFGYEHKVTAVTKNERIVIAGWCSSNDLKHSG